MCNFSHLKTVFRFIFMQNKISLLADFRHNKEMKIQNPIALKYWIFLIIFYSMKLFLTQYDLFFFERSFKRTVHDLLLVIFREI